MFRSYGKHCTKYRLHSIHIAYPILKQIYYMVYYQVVPYKECKLDVEPQKFSETKLSPKKFIEKSCTQGKKTIPHKKLLPECRNITKQNCVLTNWETDTYGKQVTAFLSLFSI